MGNCNDPMDGCLSLNKEALDAIEKDGAKRISVEEALSAMKRTYDAGFVHMAYVYDGKDKPEIICSCCRCCCHSLSAALRFGYSDHVFYSEKISRQDNSLCDNCGACVDRCQFEARKMNKDELQFEPEKCAGCGLCLMDCPTEAITMVERERTGS
jgi:ferredoxin